MAWSLVACRVRRGEPVDAEIASLLRELRQEAGLTQQTVAERAGISVNTVSALELGTRSTRAVGVAVAYQLAQALGASPARLLLAMGSGDPQAADDQGPTLDVASVPVAELPTRHDFDWDPWKAAAPDVRYAVPRPVTARRSGGVVIRWAPGAPPPLVSVAARAYLGRMRPGWVAYLSPTPILEYVSEDGQYSEQPDHLDTLSHLGPVLLSWPEAIVIATISELEHDRNHDSGFDLEQIQVARPEDVRVIARVTWWAPR